MCVCGAEVNVTHKCAHVTCICGYAVVRESVAKLDQLDQATLPTTLCLLCSFLNVNNVQFQRNPWHNS